MMIRSKMMRKSSPIPESIEVIENDGMALDEVVVSGYATETKVANTGAILKKENQISEQKEKIKFSIDGIKIRKTYKKPPSFSRSYKLIKKEM
uniref:hypothetical protein n=1 Tax=Tenacibaculum aquimarinum TaxID=2910675 RepID=UPI0035A8A6F9